MAKTTTNFGLVKPERSDNYNVDVMSTNMDIIDAMVAPKTETDAFDSRIEALEAGKFENALCTICTESNVISGLYLNAIHTLATQNTSSNVWVTNTYTYRSNPICNTVQFRTNAYGDGTQASITVNGTTVVNSVGSGYTYITKIATVTLNDGDIVVAKLLGNKGSGGTTKCELILGYLVSA